MARSNYSYEKRQQELKKKKKREEKAVRKQEREPGAPDDASEYLALLRGETPGDDTEADDSADEPEIS